MAERWDGVERRSGKERRRVKKPTAHERRKGKNRRSGLDRRHMSRNLCPYTEKPECIAWKERTLGHIIHISRYCRDYYIFCEYHKKLAAKKGKGD